MRRKRNKKVIVVLLIFLIALGGGGYALIQFSDEEKDYSSEDSEASGDTSDIEDGVLLNDFDSSDNLSSWHSGSDKNKAGSYVNDGKLVIYHDAADFYNTQNVKHKTFLLNTSKPFSLEFKVRMSEYVMGADMYTKLVFTPENYTGKRKPELIIGFNSEQHWLQTYYQQRRPPACTFKNMDDEFFISTSKEIYSGAPDTRLRYPAGIRNKYTEWTTFKITYVPDSNGLSGTIHYYVEDKKVNLLRPLDDPNNGVSTKTSFFAENPELKTELVMTILIDGEEYSYIGNQYGIRARGCYALDTPAVPSSIPVRPELDRKNGLEFKRDWMKKYDSIAKIVTQELKNITKDVHMKPYCSTKIASSANPQDMLIPNNCTSPENFCRILNEHLNDEILKKIEKKCGRKYIVERLISKLASIWVSVKYQNKIIYNGHIYHLITEKLFWEDWK